MNHPRALFITNWTKCCKGYGMSVNISDYWNNLSTVNQNISRTAKGASLWDRLAPQDCFAQYRFCTPRQKYRDVVVIIDSVQPGWLRSEVFHFDLSSNLAQIWDSHVPPDEANSLWFSAQCTTAFDNQRFLDQLRRGENSYQCTGPGCAGALGEPGGITWRQTTELQGVNWTIPVFSNSSYNIPSEYGFNESFDSFNVAYCLAEPSPDNKCKVNVSNTLLAITAGCVFLKVIICTIVLLNLPHTSLVTPGDAIESFISKPDRRTEGLGVFEVEDSHRLEYGKRQLWSGTDFIKGPRPRRWIARRRRLIRLLSKSAWIRTYTVIIIGIAIILTAIIFISIFNGIGSL